MCRGEREGSRDKANEKWRKEKGCCEQYRQVASASVKKMNQHPFSQIHLFVTSLDTGSTAGGLELLNSVFTLH